MGTYGNDTDCSAYGKDEDAGIFREVRTEYRDKRLRMEFRAKTGKGRSPVILRIFTGKTVLLRDHAGSAQNGLHCHGNAVAEEESVLL